MINLVSVSVITLSLYMGEQGIEILLASISLEVYIPRPLDCPIFDDDISFSKYVRRSCSHASVTIVRTLKSTVISLQLQLASTTTPNENLTSRP